MFSFGCWAALGFASLTEKKVQVEKVEFATGL